MLAAGHFLGHHFGTQLHIKLRRRAGKQIDITCLGFETPKGRSLKLQKAESGIESTTKRGSFVE